jgi:hypothetical protein
MVVDVCSLLDCQGRNGAGHLRGGWQETQGFTRVDEEFLFVKIKIFAPGTEVLVMCEKKGYPEVLDSALPQNLCHHLSGVERCLRPRPFFQGSQPHMLS